MTRTRLTLVALVALACAGARAQPGFALLYKQQYGYPPSCNACHKDGGGTPLNPYGEQFKKAGENLAAFDRIARLDADGDGSDNGTEAMAKANPGDKGSTPAAPGNWLDLISRIPREVQALFPGVRTWLPRDALLTDADVTRAAAMGAPLGRADDNTIYIPLADRHPIGTAIIFPARYQGKDFFLLMATDRKLVVTSVAPMNTTHVPAAARRDVYASFKGIAVDQLPAANGDGLDDVIRAAVKKAGTLLYVRLKNA